jgi:hypothetical protein
MGIGILTDVSGLSVRTQIIAYGGSKKAPFQRAIAESTTLEPGSTTNVTRDLFIGTMQQTEYATNDRQSKVSNLLGKNISYLGHTRKWFTSMSQDAITPDVVSTPVENCSNYHIRQY